MNDNNRLPEPDLLERASRALQESVPPSGPPDDLIAATVAAVHERLAGLSLAEQNRKLLRRKWIMRATKYGSLFAGAAAAIAFAIVVFLPARSAAQDVKNALKKAQQAKTLRLQVDIDAGKDGKLRSNIFIADGKVRQSEETLGLTVIMNPQDKNKMYRLVDNEKDPLVAQMVKSVTNSIGGFKIPADDKVQALPEEFLEGRKTKVYEIKDVAVEVADQKGVASMKVWIDPKTDLPIKSRTSTRLGDKTATAEMTYLGFNEDLDPRLFDMTVPAGFKELEMPKKKD